MPGGDTDRPILAVSGLRVRYRGAGGSREVLAGVDLSVREGEVLGLVGGSGGGKTTIALALLGLLPRGVAEVAGSVLFRGRELLGRPEEELRALRGREIGVVFQEPLLALNPVLSIGDQVGESAEIHLGLPRRKARRIAAEMLARVGVPEPDRRLDEYPHQLSGGMRQRALIAAALVNRPSLLVADEPTSALDVTTQAAIIELLRDLRRETGMAVLLVTHDFGVVAELADRVAVLAGGRIVEEGAAGSLFAAPRHPETRALLDAARGGGDAR